MQTSDLDNLTASEKEPRSKTPGIDPVRPNVTDLPGREVQPLPRDLPSPRHRPGEPILFDPPYNELIQPGAPFNEIGVIPTLGSPTADPLQFE